MWSDAAMLDKLQQKAGAAFAFTLLNFSKYFLLLTFTNIKKFIELSFFYYY